MRNFTQAKNIPIGGDFLWTWLFLDGYHGVILHDGEDVLVYTRCTVNGKPTIKGPASRKPCIAATRQSSTNVLLITEERR